MPKITGDIPNRSICAKVYRATYTQEAVPDYTGVYDVTPKTVAQTLQTKDKKMKDDVAVLAIPYFEISNTDGTTAIIGE